MQAGRKQEAIEHFRVVIQNGQIVQDERILDIANRRRNALSQLIQEETPQKVEEESGMFGKVKGLGNYFMSKVKGDGSRKSSSEGSQNGSSLKNKIAGLFDDRHTSTNQQVQQPVEQVKPQVIAPPVQQNPQPIQAQPVQNRPTPLPR